MKILILVSILFAMAYAEMPKEPGYYCLIDHTGEERCYDNYILIDGY